MDDNVYILGYEAGVEAGRREAVDWMSSCMLNLIYDTKAKRVAYRDYRVYDSEWQAKLKEWGIGS